MGISNAAVIVLCIVGAGAALMIGYAIGTRLWNGSADDRNDLEGGRGAFNQAAYMREVRLRNQDKILSLARSGKSKIPTDQITPTTFSAVSTSSYGDLR
ncbi:uncharacterized protein RCC_06080 [Ramularia collo-cygni]|uniref:Uncharacterized protein n=1 Tax=Ramularia collo-cygni TaxID=112498 RepID=A0A2D3VHJ4_9PEZI|nr:uncharacterized protein RCC_06080 [Ramularia collo-cygni]CZT20223.1 uncharacterized protein RCC_06080 [Ramularia collo-cygni]